MLNPNNGEPTSNIPYYLPTNTTNIDAPQLELQSSFLLKKSLQNVYLNKKSLPKIVDDEDIMEQKLESTYVNLMLIKKEKKKPDEDNQKKLDKKDESKRNDYEDIVASKEEIELKKIFDIKHEEGKKEEIKKSKNKILIYGRAGVGKTTLCQYISYKWAKKELWKDKFDFVFHLPLRALTHKWTKGYKGSITNSALEYFIHNCCFRGNDINEKEAIKTIKDILLNNKVLLILDGYDEIASYLTDKKTLENQILDKAIDSKSENIKVIMTSRPNAVRNDIRQKFEEIENIGLKEKDVYEYINKYFPETEKGKTHKKTISEFIKKSNQIKEVVQTPINLYLLCLIWDKECNFQDKTAITLTILYERITNWLKKRYLHKFRKEDLSLIRDEDLEKKCAKENNTLDRIAYEGMQKHQIIISKELIKEAGITGKDLEDMKGLGLFTAIGKEKRVIDKDHEFIHLTFQEYLAARYINKVLGSEDKKAIRETVRFIEEIKYERFYERMITFLSGIINKQGGQTQKYFWHIILNGNFALTTNQQMLLLFRCLNEVEGKQVITEYKKLGKLLGSYLQEGIDKFYKGTFEEICNYGRAVNILITEKYLKLEEVKILVNNLDNLIVLAIINNIARRRIMVKLMPLLKDKDEDSEVRSRVAGAIGKIGKVRPELIDEEVIKELLPLLKDEDKYVRSNVVDAIVEIGKVRSELIDEEVMKELLPLLKNEDSKVRSSVEYAIEEIGKVRPELTDEEVIKELLLLLKDEKSYVRRSVAYVIEEIGKVNPKEVMKELLPLLKDEDSEVRSNVVDAIVKIGKVRPEVIGEEVIKELLPLLKDEDSKVRRSVAYAIVEIGKVRPELTDEEVIKELLPLLKDKDEESEVRSSVIDAIVKIGKVRPEVIGKEVIKELLPLLKDKDEDSKVRRSVVDAIVEISKVRPEVIGKEVIKELLPLLKDEDKYVRSNAVDAIVKIGKVNPEEVIKELLPLLKDEDKYVRSNVVDAIVKIGKVRPEVIGEEVIKELLPLLKDKDEDSEVRSSVAYSIVEIGKVRPEAIGEEIIKELLPLLKDKDEDSKVRSRVAYAIGEIGKVRPEAIGEEVIKELLPLLKDEDSEVKGRVAYAIVKIGKVNPEEVIKELLPLLKNKDEDSKVRRSVAGAMVEIGKARPEVIGEEVIKELLPLLKDEDSKVRRSVAYAIVEIGKVRPELTDEEVIKELLPLLKDKDEESYVRRNVVDAIVKIGKVRPEVIGEEVIKELLPLLKDKDKDSYVRKSVVDAVVEIGKVNPEEVIKELLPLLKDEDSEVRNSIAYSIEEIGKVNPEEVIKELLPLLKDEDSEVRNSVAYAINNLPLKHLLSHCISNLSFLESKELINILSKTQLMLETKGITILSNKSELVPFVENNDYAKHQTVVKIFNAFYEYNISEKFPTIFFESACNYKKPLNIEGIELIQDIIPTNKYLEQSSRSLIDSQYKLSTLNWTISIVRKDKSVSKEEGDDKHVFIILEGKSIFYTSILHRFELILEKGKENIEKIVIESKMHISNEVLEECFQELLGNKEYTKGVRFEKGEDYDARTCAIDSQRVDELYEEIQQERTSGFNGFSKFIGGQEINFTWVGEKLKKYLDKKEFEKLGLSTEDNKPDFSFLEPHEIPNEVKITNEDLLDSKKVYEEKPWHFDPAIKAKIPKIKEGEVYRLIEGSEKDKQKVVECYQLHPVAGYDIGKVEIIYNPRMNRKFELYLQELQERYNSKVFTPTWQNEKEEPIRKQWRRKIGKLFEDMAKRYVDKDCPEVKILPLWHGTSKEIIDILFKTGYVNFADIDGGEFGDGIYFTHDAEYAYRVYSRLFHGENGCLLFNWVACFSAYPLIDGDMDKLEGVNKKDYKKYDGRFIPVVPTTPYPPYPPYPYVIDYKATRPDQEHTYTELVVSQSAACLPRYLVTLQPILPKMMPYVDKIKKYIDDNLAEGKMIHSHLVSIDSNNHPNYSELNQALISIKPYMIYMKDILCAIVPLSQMIRIKEREDSLIFTSDRKDIINKIFDCIIDEKLPEIIFNALSKLLNEFSETRVVNSERQCEILLERNFKTLEPLSNNTPEVALTMPPISQSYTHTELIEKLRQELRVGKNSIYKGAIEQALVSMAGINTDQGAMFNPKGAEEIVFGLKFSSLREYNKFVNYYNKNFFDLIKEKGSYNPEGLSQVVMDTRILYNEVAPALGKYISLQTISTQTNKTLPKEQESCMVM